MTHSDPPRIAVDALLGTRRRLLVGGAAALALGACGRQSAQVGDGLHLTGSAMASSYNVKLAHGAGVDATRVHDAVQSALAAVEARMSLYRPDSELAQLNRRGAGQPLTLSPELFAVLAAAQRVSELADGAFDVTVAPLVQAWGFGTEKRRKVPPAHQVEDKRAAVGWRGLRLDAGTLAATKARADLHVDLGGIAKGYGVDRAALALDALGVTDYMVELGGEVRTRGHNTAGQPWRIGIEQPDAVPPRARHVVPLAGRSMATSGDYRNYFEQDGRRYSHAIDPARAAPIAHALCSVSVVADDCMQADALATALIVLGAERGRALAERAGIAAQFIERAADGRWRDSMTRAFAALGQVSA
jgi:thiamine biosynthesis lipoprotein